MKKSLLSLLVLSLAGNITLAFFAFGPSTPSASPADLKSAATTSPRPTAPATGGPGEATASPADPAKAFAWTNLAPTSDLHALVAGLRAAGFPSKTIAVILRQVLSERMMANDPRAGLPYWQRNNPPKTVLQAQQAAYRGMQDEIKTLLGPDQSADLADQALRAQRYGGISDAKVAAISKIESDYSDIRQAAYNDNPDGIMTPAQMATQQKQQRMLEQEKHADLAAVLSPEELAQYDLRNSLTASKVMSTLRNMDVSEQEYTSLYGLQKAFDDANLSQPNSPASYAQRMAAQAQLTEQVRSVLSDDRFYSYLAKTDYNYVQAQQVTAQFPTITPATTYELSKLTQEVQGKMMGPGTPGSPAMSPADRSALIADYTTQITTLLGPDAADAYKKSNLGRWMNLPVRRTAATGGQ